MFCSYRRMDTDIQTCMGLSTKANSNFSNYLITGNEKSIWVVSCSIAVNGHLMNGNRKFYSGE